MRSFSDVVTNGYAHAITFMTTDEKEKKFRRYKNLSVASPYATLIHQ